MDYEPKHVTELVSGTPEQQDIFVTTRWTVVLEARNASPQSEQALEEICRTYWFPLYAYVRRRGHSPEDAEDLTQEFFRRLLEHRWIDDADREKGRLRAFLITALKHFMAKEWRRVSAQKRGSGLPCISIESGLAEGRYADSETPSLDAEALFDRQWALAVLNAAIQRLENEFSKVGKSEEFAVLKESLALSRDTIDYADISKRLGVKEGAARVAVHRLRKRFRTYYREEIAQTLPQETDLDEEVRYLAACLAKE